MNVEDPIYFQELPKSCPACIKPFSTALAPKRELRPVAKLPITLGILVSTAIGAATACAAIYYDRIPGRHSPFVPPA